MYLYQFAATTFEGFIQQLAVCYIGRGYWYYVTGSVPEGKDPHVVDEKLLRRYDIAVAKWTRSRRKQTGAANLQYLRFRRFFVLLATMGRHRFFEEESTIRDVRRLPLCVGGYALSYSDGAVKVRIERGEYLRIKSYFLTHALSRSAEHLRSELQALPFEPYSPIRHQLLGLVKAVNRIRIPHNLPLLPGTAVRTKRRLYRPFEPVETVAEPLKTGTG